MAQAFFGRFTCPLDDKNRAVLPLRLREAVEPDRLRDGFVITQGFEGSLLLLLRDTWRELTKIYEKLEFTDPNARLFMRFFFSSASETPIDRIGRITVADFQRQIAGIDREVLFNGMNDHIEIWSPERWEKWSGENIGHYSRVAALLKSGGGSSPGPKTPQAEENWPPSLES